MIKLFFRDGTTKILDFPFHDNEQSKWRMKEMVNGNNNIIKIEVEIKTTQTFRRGE